jgi:hypothetical protein
MGLSDWWLLKKLDAADPVARSAAIEQVGADHCGGNRVDDRFVAQLLRELRGQAEGPAAKAAWVFKTCLDPRARDALAETFAGSPSAHVSSICFDALKNHAASAELAARFPTDPARRLQSLGYLSRCTAPEGEAVLDRCFTDNDARVRRAAAELAGALRAKASPLRAEALERMLSDNDAQTRRVAARALTAMGWRAPTPEQDAKIAVAVGDWSRVAALGPAAIPALVAALDPNEHSSDKAGALAALGERAVPALAEAMVNDVLVQRCAEVLGAIGGEAACAALGRALRSGWSRAREAARDALVQLRSATARDALEAALVEGGAGAFAAAEGLAASGDAGLAILVRHLSSCHRHVRSPLAAAGPRAVRLLSAALLSDTRDEARAAAALLTELNWQPTTDDERLLLALSVGKYDVLTHEGEVGQGLLSWELAEMGEPSVKLIEALASFPGEEVTRELAGVVETKNDAAAQAAVRAIGMRKDPAGLPALALTLMKGTGGYGMSSTLEGALKAFGAAAIPALAARLPEATGEGERLLLRRLDALGWRASDAAMRARVQVAMERWSEIRDEASRDPEPYLRLLEERASSELAGALMSLRAHDGQAALLSRHARSAQGRVRRVAVHLLGGMRGAAVDDLLCEALGDQDADVRLAAVRGLEGRADGATDRVRQSLRHALAAGEWAVRCWAAQGLLRAGETIAHELPTVVRALFPSGRAAGLPDELHDGPFARAIGFDHAVHTLVLRAFGWESKEIGDKYSNAIPDLDAGDHAASSLCAARGLYADCALEALASLADFTISLPCCAYSKDWTLDLSYRRRQAASEVSRRGLPPKEGPRA